jgi:hypothetical protein
MKESLAFRDWPNRNCSLSISLEESNQEMKMSVDVEQGKNRPI